MKSIYPMLLLMMTASLDVPAETAREVWDRIATKGTRTDDAMEFVPHRAGLPNVLIYGDSISIDYTTNLRALLHEEANVYRLHTNGGDSGEMIAKITTLETEMRAESVEDRWEFDWDVIHFNVGLHDLKYVNAQGQLDNNGEQVHSLEDYKLNLRAGIDFLKDHAPGARLVFALTTPVPANSLGRVEGDAALYNAAAREVLAEYPEIVVNDLHAFTLPNQTEWWVAPGDVHYNLTGRNAQAMRVAGFVRQALSPGAVSNVIPHPIVPGDTPSPEVVMSINQTAVPVVDWFGPFSYAHASLPAEGPVTVQILVTEGITSYRISPLREGLTGTVRGKVLTFTADRPQYLAVKINDLDTLFIFCDPEEIDAPAPGDPEVIDLSTYGVDTGGSEVETAKIQQAIADVSAQEGKSILYFPPGHYRAGTLRLLDGVTLYLPAGALLQASDDPTHFNRDHPGGTYRRLNFITAYQVSNVGIRGRGVIDGNANYLRTVLPTLPAFTVSGRPDGLVDANRIVNVQFSHADNMLIEGVYSRNSSSWNTIPHYCTDIDIRNYKVMSDMIWTAYKNEDAIDPDSCVRLTIEDSFFLARDDGIVLKTTGTYNGQRISPDGTSRDMHDVVIRNNMIWCETAALKYGWSESEASEIYNLLFEDNVILMTREGVQLRTRGPGFVRDAIFRRNTYEAYGDFTQTARNYWLDDADARDIQFIDETHATFGSTDNLIRGTRITFRNLRIAGVLHTTLESARFDNQGTESSISADGVGATHIIDNGDPGYSESGDWVTSTGQSDQRYGASYRVGEDGTGAADTWAAWTPALTGPERMKVYLWWTSHENRPSLAPVEIHHTDGVKTLTVNQQADGGQWKYLGTYDFEPGSHLKLFASAPGFTIADAARFEEVDPPAGAAFDFWLYRHFEVGADPDVDTVVKDGKDVTLRQAYLLGDNPHDPDDVLRSIIEPYGDETTSGLRIRFPSLENRVYRVEESLDLKEWSTDGDLLTASGDWIEFLPAPRPGEALRYFRIRALFSASE